MEAMEAMEDAKNFLPLARCQSLELVNKRATLARSVAPLCSCKHRVSSDSLDQYGKRLTCSLKIRHGDQRTGDDASYRLRSDVIKTSNGNGDVNGK